MTTSALSRASRSFPAALALAAATCIVLAAPASAGAAPSVRVPAQAPAGHGFVLTGSGFPARAVVQLAVGPPRSEAYPVVKVRATRAGTIRSVQRVGVPGRWVWVATAGRSRATIAQRVVAGARLTTTPSAVAAGTPFTITGTGMSGGIQFQYRTPGSTVWRVLGARRAVAGRVTMPIAADHPVLGTSAAGGDWLLRACTNLCRTGLVATREAYVTLAISKS